MHGITAAATLALATLAAAAPAPAYTTDSTFTIVAKVTKAGKNVTVDNSPLIGYHIGAGQSAGVFGKPSTATGLANGGNQFLQNKTAAGNTKNSAVFFLGNGYPFFFAPHFKNSTDAAGRREVDLSVGGSLDQVGTKVQLVKSKDGKSTLPQLTYTPTTGEKPGQFYACHTDLAYGYKDVNVLYWRPATAKTPAGCAEVALYPQCAGKQQTAFQPGFAIKTEKVACIKNVSKTVAK